MRQFPAIVMFLSFLIVSSLLAQVERNDVQPPPEKPPQQKPAPEKPKSIRVIITKVDGAKVSGVLQSVDHDGVSIQQNPKVDPVTIAWKEIKTVSNGLTREKAIAEWKQTHKDQLCEACKGDRGVACVKCNGSSVDPRKKVDCTKCSGSGSAGVCKDKKCKEGKIDCPEPCLKLSQGTWTERDGLRWRTFRNRDGSTRFWSERHLGEIVIMENGTAENKGKCPKCDGATNIPHESCGGTGKEKCPPCKGFGFTGPTCSDCTDGQTRCESCGGDGLRD